MEVDTKRTTYSVVDPHAYRIGGKRVSAARTVDLSDVEAEHELRVGSIVPNEAVMGVSAVEEASPEGWAEVAAENSAAVEEILRDRKGRK